MSERERIGFIGLGYMGHGMAKNIAEKGWPLTVLARRKRDAVEDMIGRGAVEADTPAKVAAASDIVVLCVTSSRQVEEIVGGAGGLLETLKPGSVVIDCSTADPTSTLKLAEMLAAKSIDFVDAPLGRTPKEAWDGTLDVMVGASPEVYARIEPLLSSFAGRIVHVGGTGDGHKMKLLNNFLSMSYAALYAEALALSRKVGISPETFDSVISGGRMDCGFYQTFMRWTLEGDPNAHKFSLVNGLKDLTYVEAMAASVGMANPLGNAAKNSFAMAVARDPEGLVPVLADHVATQNGVDLSKA